MQKNSSFMQLVCIISIANITSLFGSHETLSSTANEEAFRQALVDIAINPAEANLSTLRKTIIPQKIRAEFIVETLMKSGLPKAPSPAIKVIAEECPYAFFIARNAQPFPLDMAIKCLNLGFMCVLVKLDDKENRLIPVAHLLIESIENLEHAENLQENCFKQLETLLNEGLNPFYGYKHNHNLYTAVCESCIKNEKKLRLTSMFNNAFSQWPEEMKLEKYKYMFRRGSKFNWVEKGYPFALKDHDDYLSYFS